MNRLPPDKTLPASSAVKTEIEDPLISETDAICGETLIGSRTAPAILLEGALERSRSRTAPEAFQLVGEMFYALHERRASSALPLESLQRRLAESGGRYGSVAVTFIFHV